MEKFDWGDDSVAGGDGEGKKIIRGGEEEEEAWNKSSFKRFDWDEGIDDRSLQFHEKNRYYFLSDQSVVFYILLW